MLEQFFLTTVEGSCSELFLNVLNMSISASYLILAVMAARVLLKKAPKRIRVFLWILVGIRLVLPFSIESVFSLIPSNTVIEADIMYEMQPEINTGISAVDTAVNQYMRTNLTPADGDSINPMQVITIETSVIWTFGMFAMFCYFIFSLLRLRNKVKTAVPREINGTKIYQSDVIESPFLFGILRPRIYVPFEIEESDLSYVVIHETAHRKRKDYLIKPIGFLLLTVYWFNPMIWIAYILLCRDIELACDEMVIKNIDIDCKKEYSQALLSCAVNRRAIAACPVAFGEVGVKARVKNVLNYKKPTFWVMLAMVAVCVIVPACFMTQKKEVEFSLADISGKYLMVYENSEDVITMPCLILYEDGTFTFGYDPLSSYFPYGTYYVEDGYLVMLTNDGRYHYRFQIKGENTLTFQQEYSSEIQYTDERLAVNIEDNALFLKQPGEPTEKFDVINDTLTAEKLAEGGLELEVEALKEKQQKLQEEIELIANEQLEKNQTNLTETKQELQEEYELIQELLGTDGDSLLRIYEGVVDAFGILYQSPVEYEKISDTFGRRTHPISGETIYHGGIDLAATEGTPVTAAAEGIVYETGFDYEFGNYVILLHGNGEMTYYACCQEFLVKKGQKVAVGEQIATVGNTGRSTGAHLHFAISSNGEYIKPEFEEK